MCNWRWRGGIEYHIQARMEICNAGRLTGHMQYSRIAQGKEVKVEIDYTQMS